MYKGPHQREEKPSEDDKRFALEHIAQAIRDWDWSRSTAMAYCDQIYQTLLANRGWRLDKPETLCKYIERANLPMDKGIADALSEAWGRSSYARCKSYDEFVLDAFHGEGHLDTKNTGTYLSIIQNLGEKNHWRMKAYVQEAIDESTKRQRLISSITGA